MTKKLKPIGDPREITIGCYTLTATGLEVRGRPSYEEHQGVGEFIERAHCASGWWLADWLRYGDTRADWAERLVQAHHQTGLSEKTLVNVRAIGAIDKSRRRAALEFSLHDCVTKLPADEQVFWLARAEVEGWTRSELRAEIRAASRTKVIEGQAILEGLYRVIYADPPWRYSDSGATVDGSLGKTARHYADLSMAELLALPVAAHALPHAVLFLWVTVPMLLEHPGPRDVIEAWGFKPKTGLVWDKVLGLPGHYGLQIKHEHLIIATRGSCLPNVPLPHDDSVLVERRGHEHSRKPESVRRFIERHWTKGPYLELFGREPHAGWSVFGNDPRLWSEEAATA